MDSGSYWPQEHPEERPAFALVSLAMSRWFVWGVIIGGDASGYEPRSQRIRRLGTARRTDAGDAVVPR